jgi:hypothetical protein
LVTLSPPPFVADDVDSLIGDAVAARDAISCFEGLFWEFVEENETTVRWKNGKGDVRG